MCIFVCVCWFLCQLFLYVLLSLSFQCKKENSLHISSNWGNFHFHFLIVGLSDASAILFFYNKMFLYCLYTCIFVYLPSCAGSSKKTKEWKRVSDEEFPYLLSCVIVQVQVTGTACGPPSTLVQVQKQQTPIEWDFLFILRWPCHNNWCSIITPSIQSSHEMENNHNQHYYQMR